MIRIAHILPWTAIGGTEHATLRIGRAIEGDRFHSLFYCPSNAPAIREFYAAAGFEAFDYDLVEPHWRWPWRFLANTLRLAAQFRRQRVDIVHCADLMSVRFAALAARLAGCRLLCQIRNRNDDIPRREWRLMHLVHQYIFVSKASSDCFDYPAEESRRRVLYDGIDPASVTPYSHAAVRDMFGLPPGSRLIGTSARVNPQKDFPTLIEAAAAVVERFPEARFLIIGDYEKEETNRRHFQELQPLLDRFGVRDKFVFAGFRSDAQPLIAAMDLFVLSTHFEGLPLVVLEAMAQARPVVATAVDGLPETIVEGETGYLVAHKDAAQLAGRICAMLVDPERAMQMGEAGKRRVLAEFTQRAFATQLQDLYNATVR
jgi:glycosyltransferase involved in cell wall biosynthesis